MTARTQGERWELVCWQARMEGWRVAAGKLYSAAVADAMRSAILLGCVPGDGLDEEATLSIIVSDAAMQVELDAQARIQRVTRPLIENRKRRAVILAAAARANLAVLHWQTVKAIVGADMQAALASTRRRLVHA